MDGWMMIKDEDLWWKQIFSSVLLTRYVHTATLFFFVTSAGEQLWTHPLLCGTASRFPFSQRSRHSARETDTDKGTINHCSEPVEGSRDAKTSEAAPQLHRLPSAANKEQVSNLFAACQMHVTPFPVSLPNLHSRSCTVAAYRIVSHNCERQESTQVTDKSSDCQTTVWVFITAQFYLLQLKLFHLFNLVTVSEIMRNQKLNFLSVLRILFLWKNLRVTELFIHSSSSTCIKDLPTITAIEPISRATSTSINQQHENCVCYIYYYFVV